MPPAHPGIPPAFLDLIWSTPEVRLRERVLWLLLHESGAPVRALDVEDLDLDDRRARGRGVWVSWRARTAGLLPELVADASMVRSLGSHQRRYQF